MKIYIIAKAGSRKEFVKQVDETHFTVAVHEPPIDGKANLAIIKALAEYFQKSPSQLEIIFRETSKRKTIEVYE